MPKPKTKAPRKYRWFCRHCSKHQNHRAPRHPHPLCESCGRSMETHDVIVPESPAEVAAALRTAENSPPAVASSGPSIGARTMQAIVDLRRRVDSIDARLKAPQDVLAELQGALLAKP